MKRYGQGKNPPILIILIAVGFVLGGFVYSGSLPVPEELLSSFETSSGKCASEIEADIETLNPRRFDISLIETQSFGSPDKAGEFLLERGYKNALGHATLDVSEADSKDLSVAIISLQSQLPSREDESMLVTMELTQPIACVGGSIAPRSKEFLNTILKNEPGVRAAIYQLGRAVD